jgi:precorrin-8X/cobalt-precorrin-8 methylmutase
MNNPQTLSSPGQIERESFRLIENELADRTIEVVNATVIKRVIHTTADFDYADNLVFSPAAVNTAKAALSTGAHIITDTKMAMAGVNRAALESTGSTIDCYIDDPEVVANAKASGLTRAMTAVDFALTRLDDPLIFVIGNAPTALIRLCDLINADLVRPALIVGVPVGFVNVIESKEMALTLPTEHIVAVGRKGGSTVAAAIVNALLYDAVGRTPED